MLVCLSRYLERLCNGAQFGRGSAHYCHTPMHLPIPPHTHTHENYALCVRSFREAHCVPTPIVETPMNSFKVVSVVEKG